jgi:metal-sulfur cluster biosynthetic enzyme
VQRKLLELPGVGEANVEVVFDPPWSLSRVTPDGKKTLGLP